MTILGCGGTAWAILLIPVLYLTRGRPALTICVIGAEGIFILGIMVALIAFAATIYPTSYRATGVGVALTWARVGAVLSAFMGPFALARGGVHTFFALIACAMAISTGFVVFTQPEMSDDVQSELMRSSSRSVLPSNPLEGTL
jgi:AAHS family 4-hydroxybenzoate transporter-like MFS transporter